MNGKATAAAGAQSGAESAGERAGPLRDLLLSLADSKRLLGIRYSDRVLGSPSLETGIAAASMAQDEWGHSRLTYALLTDFGDDPAALEHGRDAAAYHSMEVLDRPFDGYPTFIAAALLLDGALTEQYRALSGSRYEPVRNRVQKLLDEEALHARFAEAWADKLSGGRAREDFVRWATLMLDQALHWLGPEGDGLTSGLVEGGYADAGPDELRRRLLARTAPVLDRCGLADEVGLRRDGSGAEWSYARRLDWSEWDSARRRASAGGPDPETLARVRGDRNRVLLIDT